MTVSTPEKRAAPKLLPLKPGDMIGVMAPSSHVERTDIEKSAAFLDERGYRVFIHPQTFERHHQSAGTHDQKLSAFHELWENRDIHAIWAAGGGNRALHILDDVDFDLIRSNPKPFIGFSDITTLLNGIYAHTGLTTFHGPVFGSVHRHTEVDNLLALLGGESHSYHFADSLALKPGQAEGILVGGNLSLFQYLPQTLSGNFWKGSILFLEDCNEELSRIDRMFLHLKRLGVLSDVSGLIIGEFVDIQDSSRPFGFSLEDIVREHTKDLDIPILVNAPFGHGKNLLTFPVGTHAKMDSENKLLILS